MNHLNRKARYVLLAGAALFAPGAWSMPPETITRSEVVKYDPMVAATPEGATQLYAKLQRAAARVCDERSGAAGGGRPTTSTTSETAPSPPATTPQEPAGAPAAPSAPSTAPAPSEVMPDLEIKR